jgi:hypothetical protein
MKQMSVKIFFLVLIVSSTFAGGQQAPGTWARAGKLVSAGNEAYLMNDGRVFVPGSDLVGTVGPQIWDAVSSTWTLLPAHIYGRIGSASVVLNDGRVLVTGGQTSLNTAEIYDPILNQWKLSANTLVVGRYFHRMTKLNDGRVLLTGGCDAYACATAAAQSEVYDPVTDTFTASGSMSIVRTFHTSTLLNDGQVLIAGGYTNTGTGVSRIAEIYDPATGVFTRTGSMTATRSEHTGTLMKDGRVLITGGSTDYGAISRATEIFNPTTGKWTKTPNMSAVRYEHSAILLPDGKVMVAGGYSILKDAYVVLRLVELFDPSTGTFIKGAPMLQPRLQFGLLQLQDGRILAVGGDYAVIGPHRIFYGDAETYQP